MHPYMHCRGGDGNQESLAEGNGSTHTYITYRGAFQLRGPQHAALQATAAGQRGPCTDSGGMDFWTSRQALPSATETWISNWEQAAACMHAGILHTYSTHACMSVYDYTRP